MAQTTLGVEADVSCWSSGIAAGAGSHLPVGDYGSADYRAAMRFPIPAGWTAWTAITSATLKFYISDHNHVAPKNSSIYCSRQNVTTPLWTKSAGTQSCESGFTAGNNTQYGDIVSVSTDRISFSSGSTANAAKTLDVTAMVRYYWGSNSKLVFVFDNNGADQYTELWSDEKSGYDAVLTINYETNTPPNAPTLNSPNASVEQSTNPTLNLTPSDPQGDVCAAYRYQVALDSGFTSIYEDVTVTGPFTNGVATNRVVVNTLPRNATYWWRAQTSDASGYGPWSGGAWFSVKANPVVTINANRRMVYNGAPRLAVDWTTDQPQGQFRVTAPGYDSGVRSGGDQSWTLDTLALANGTPVNVTVQVWNTDGAPLTASAARSFTPRWGLTTHKRTLADTPVNWQQPSVVASVPAGAQLVIEYGTGTAAGDAAPTAWFSSFASVPKTPYLHWRAWFIPNATQGPTLDTITIAYDKTVAVLDKWGVNPVWPWEANGGIPARYSIDPGEAVYGTRSLRADPDGPTARAICSVKFKVREGRSYTLSGLMRSQGTTGAGAQIQNGTTAFAKMTAKTTPGVLTDWERYKSPVWVAPADMDVYVSCFIDSAATPAPAAGSTAWWDGVKVEESIVATPWSPASVGATTLDAGGVQIDGTKGGILRYKGTFGGLRDTVEGGANGLLFGGDANLFSGSPRSLEMDGYVIGAPNHVTNGGFEQGSVGWTQGGSLGVIASDDSVGGAQSLKFPPGGYSYWAQSPKFRAGRRYVCSFWMKATAGFTSSGAGVVIEGLPLTSGNNYVLVGTVPTVWTRYSFTFVPSVDTVNAFLVTNTYGGTSTGTIWFDDVLLQDTSATGYAEAPLRGGTVFTGDARPGMRFFRTDWGMDFYFDGNRWVSTPLETTVSWSALTGAATVPFPFALRSGDSIAVWLRDLTWNYYVAGTHNGSAYWRLQVNTYDNGAYNTPLDIATNGATAYQWVDPPTNGIGYHAATSWRHLYIYLNKIGTPGPITGVATLRYQWTPP